ncbi:hypothetical protein GCM10027589_13970 [Actinocorallia lasiicapitis]
MSRALRRRATATALTLAAGALAVTAQAPAAHAAVDPVSPALTFEDCPALPAGADPDLWICSAVVITGGKLKMGTIDQDIVAPLKLTYANGYDPETFEEFFIFKPIKASPIKVTGGLFGFPGSDFLPILQIGALPLEAATPVASPEPTLAYRLKLKVKVINQLLGDTCVIGSTADPITLNLTMFTTSPPAPNKPISGSPPEIHPDDPQVITATVVDNAFSVPKSQNCGPFGLFSVLADLRAGLPAKAGTNTAIFNTQLKIQTYPAPGAARKVLTGVTPEEASKALKQKAIAAK